MQLAASPGSRKSNRGIQKPRRRFLTALAEKEGLKVTDITLTKGNHVALQVENSAGRTKTVVAALTPSDNRSDRNTRSLLRRHAEDLD